MIDAPKNRYLVNGHNYHNSRLAIYLQVMEASSQKWHKCAHNGKWKIKQENPGEYAE